MTSNITPEDAEEYSQSLAQIGEGWWRQVAWAFRQRIPEALGMSRREWAEKYHGYARMLPDDRKAAVAELSEEGLNNSEIADTLGVDERTIRRDLRPDSANADSDDASESKSQAVEPQSDADPANAESEPLTADEERDGIHALLEGEPDPGGGLIAELESIEDAEAESESVGEHSESDEPPPVKAEPEPLKPAEPGWHKLGDHLLYCGDSTDEEFVAACQGALAFADPPYNAGKAAWDEGFEWRHDYLAEVADIVAVTPGIAALAGFLADTEMPYQWSMAAEITNGMTSGALRFGNWICVTLFSHGSIYRKAKDHVRIPAATGDDQGGGHVARKPVRLLTHLIELFTTKGDTVVDPFLGSGTTLIAADRTGRRCVGAELDPMHCADIIARYHAEADGR